MIQANTFAATGQAALSAGLRPKFFDIQNKLSCASYDSFVEKYEKRVPLKRMASPGDIAPSVSFLLSDDAKYITGHNLVVDGGWTSV